MKPNTRVRIINYYSRVGPQFNVTEGTFVQMSESRRFYEIRCDVDGQTRLFKSDEFEILEEQTDPKDKRIAFLEKILDEAIGFARFDSAPSKELSDYMNSRKS